MKCPDCKTQMSELRITEDSTIENQVFRNLVIDTYHCSNCSCNIKIFHGNKVVTLKSYMETRM